MRDLLASGIASLVILILAAGAFYHQLVLLRVVSLSLVVALLIGPYAAQASLHLTGSDSVVVALAAAALSGGIVGVTSGRLDLVFFERAGVMGLLASLGLLRVSQGVISAATGGGIDRLSVTIPERWRFGGVLAAPDWLPVGIVVLALALALLFLILPANGLTSAALAVGDDPLLARTFGISPTRIYDLSQSVGGALAGCTGLLIALDSGLRPDLGMTTILKAFGILIALRGRLTRFIPLAAVLSLVELLAAYFGGGHLREAAGLSFLMAVLLVQDTREPVRIVANLRKPPPRAASMHSWRSTSPSPF